MLALFVDLFSIASKLSLAFQDNVIDSVSALRSIKKTKENLQKFENHEFEKLPFVRNFLSKFQTDSVGDKTYQNIKLKTFQTSFC